jgi:hypothetical protein
MVSEEMKRFAAILLALVSACGDGATEQATSTHARLDAATLRSIPDADVEQAVVDYVSSQLDGDEDHEAQILKGLPAGVRATWLTWIVEAEVNNGGFNQYYYNTDGRFASEAVAAFEYFGAKEHATLMKEANAVRAAEAAEMRKYKDKGTLEAFSESYEHSKLGPLDDRFYKLKEDLSQLRIARIRQKPEDFSGE